MRDADQLRADLGDDDNGPGGGASGPKTRARSRRMIQPKSLSRINPKAARGTNSVELLRIVGRLGAVPLLVAARLSTAVTGRVAGNTYWAAQALEQTGVVRRALVREDLRAGRAPGVGLILAPDERWYDGVEAAGVASEAGRWNRPSSRARTGVPLSSRPCSQARWCGGSSWAGG